MQILLALIAGVLLALVGSTPAAAHTPTPTALKTATRAGRRGQASRAIITTARHPEPSPG